MSHNLIRVAPGGTYFCFADGRPYMPIGHNSYSEVFTVYGFESTLWPAELLEERFARLAENGGNFLRLFISANLQRGFFATGEMDPEEVARLDLVYRLGEKYGIYFYVELLMSQYWTTWYQVDQFIRGPYAAQNGGPLHFDAWEGEWPGYEAPDFLDKYYARIRMGYSLDNADFVAAQEAKLRWFVERYGGHPHTFCWGLSNDFPLAEETEDVLQPWLAHMSGYLREIDPHDHLVTLQMASGTVWPQWILDCVDFTSIRAYPWSTPGMLDDAVPEHMQNRNPSNIAQWLIHKAEEHLAFGMPTICGEYGACTRRDEATGRFSLDNRDPWRARGTLYGLWAPLCSGSMPGHRWTGYDGFYHLTQEEYGWLLAIRRFSDRINWTGFRPERAEHRFRTGHPECSVAALADPHLLIAWIWDRGWVASPRRLELTLELDDPPSGPARIEWVDCHTGRIYEAQRVEQVPDRLPVPGGLEECVALVIRSE